MWHLSGNPICLVPNGSVPNWTFRVPGMHPLTKLALRARNGDRAALDQLVEGTYDQVWQLCARLIDPASADDLAQDTFLRAVAALPGYRGEASVRTWLLTIARNTCMDELRTRTRRRRRDREVADRTSRQVHAAHDAGQRTWVSDIVTRLDAERREAFVLTQIIGLTYAEAAEVCGCPTGTIRSRVARARSDLLGALEQTDEPYSSSNSMYPMTNDMTS
jgi:RNA polymerase sigma-70 factor (ECF subfamily)